MMSDSVRGPFVRYRCHGCGWTVEEKINPRTALKRISHLRDDPTCRKCAGCKGRELIEQNENGSNRETDTGTDTKPYDWWHDGL